jgi:hypothetical protein
MTYRALLIGNSTFEADAALNALNAPTKDVARLHGALVDPDSGLFQDERVRLVTERKHDEILDELDEFFASGSRDDLMLLYYSGHGVLDEFNNLYLCGRDTRSDRLARTGISDATINDFIRGAASRRTVLVLDCCSSGMFKGGAIGSQLGGPGRYIVSSARGKTLANDAQSPTGTSLFTEHLVEGLLGGARDINGDGLIDLHEIYDYVKKRLSETSKQVPNIRFEGDGDISIARCKHTPAIAIATDSSNAAPRHSVERAFGLSESVITLRDVDPDEHLTPEVIEICRFTDDDMDFAVETLNDWLRAEVVADRLVVKMRPREGTNRGKILVRDRRSGSVQTLRVDAFVRSRSAPERPASGRPTVSAGSGKGPDTGTAAAAEPTARPTAERTAQSSMPASAGASTRRLAQPRNRQAAPPNQQPPVAPVPTHQPWVPPQHKPHVAQGEQYPPQNQPWAAPPNQLKPPRSVPRNGEYLPPRSQPYVPPPNQAPLPQPLYVAPHGQGVAQQGNNGMAIASLVLSLIWIWGVGSIAAILLGRSAKKQIARTGQGGSGIATAGVVIGWIGLALMVLVIVGALAANSGSQF